MIILTLLILLLIVCGYSWVAYKVKTSVPKVYTVTAPKPHER